MSKALWIGENPWQSGDARVEGGYTELDGEVFYKISNCDGMRPFFMTIVSPADHWLFISSNGGLTAGRKSPESALFPYETDDKITENTKRTGSKSILKIERGDKRFLWEPFSDRHQGIYRTERHLYKNREGCTVVFEEINHDLEAVFRVAWSSSERLGFIRKATLQNRSDQPLKAEFVDGMQNILPHGVGSGLQTSRSNLADAYKKNELDQTTGLGMFTLSSMIIDRAEPSEALMCSVAWSAGIPYDHIFLSGLQLDAFRKDRPLKTETQVKAEKGAYFIHASVSIPSEQESHWYIVANVDQSMAKVTSLQRILGDVGPLPALLEQELEASKTSLREMLGSVDAMQLTNDPLSSGRHLSNVLFNIMRGGTFQDQYQIESEDLVEFVQCFNRQVFERHRSFFEALPAGLGYQQLQHAVKALDDRDLQRLCLEYLPLSFSRRHGDPSRPWNHFSIETKDTNGHTVKNYEGNWRDIFQNWEALAHSFPEYIEGMILRFVNASTIDGYNPYRVMRDGIDWEVNDPSDPWSYIGYWGDHQIIYLLKLLELSKSHHPDLLKDMLLEEVCVYANVPYKIRGYDAIIMDPRETIDYDHVLAAEIEKRVAQIGGDGKMSWDAQGRLMRANLLEKLLVTSLTKLYNFVPEGGIWLNTQRPEWNDANNALVGNGLSVVTLGYLRRFIVFFIDLMDELDGREVTLNKPVADLLDALYRAFKVRERLLDDGFSDEERKKLMDRFGIAGEHYRTSAYAGFLGRKQHVGISDVKSFYQLALRFVEHSLKANERQDGLYHSYNLLTLSEEQAEVGHLYEMLEGQVAILSANSLSPEESLQVLESLKASEMYRADQYSYMLYPDRELDSFLLKNNIPSASVSESSLLQRLLKDNDGSLVEQGESGTVHFNGRFHNAQDVASVLEALSHGPYAAEVQEEREFVLQLFEQMFNHQSFTGRSGTFFGYEGLGSIYWHMVSKLLLAIQETICCAVEDEANQQVVGGLIEHYYEIRAGIGLNKSPELYGAFPTDAYSHTPKNKGAQQPGMTGQVKEDIINRWAELGVRIQNGCIHFSPSFLRSDEFLEQEGTFEYFDLGGRWQEIALSPGQLTFTYCQVPIVYTVGDQSQVTIHTADKQVSAIQGSTLTQDVSRSIFQREGRVERLEVVVVLS